jgi:flagellar hook-associated protein 3 FlgL
MRISSLSTAALWEAGRRSSELLRTRLAEAQQELSQGRLADTGRALGFRLEASIALRLDRGERTTTIEAIGLAQARIDVMQSQLGGIRATAESMLDTLGPARGISINPGIIRDQATAAMTGLIGGLATTFDGARIFGGEQTELLPLTNYFAEPAPAARTAVHDAFLARFGFAIGDAQVADIVPSEMEAFIAQDFMPLFSSPQWETLWSGASQQPVVTRVSATHVFATSVTATAQPFRDLAAAYTMLADVGSGDMGAGAFQVLVDRSLALVARAATGIAYESASLGTAEQTLSGAAARHTAEIDIIDRRVNALESIDPFEAATRARALMDQLEVSYALTARIQNLSLVRYL